MRSYADLETEETGFRKFGSLLWIILTRHRLFPKTDCTSNSIAATCPWLECFSIYDSTNSHQKKQQFCHLIPVPFFFFFFEYWVLIVIFWDTDTMENLFGSQKFQASYTVHLQLFTELNTCCTLVEINVHLKDFGMIANSYQKSVLLFLLW